MTKIKIYIALPLMNELENMHYLIENLKDQTEHNFELWVCVNQPDSWWNEASKVSVCENNQKTIDFLNAVQDFSIRLFDKSSIGNGWDEKNFGVGWARKTVMDAIAKHASDEDIILTLDGDTAINPNYIKSIFKTIQSVPKAVALSVPYYHPLTGDEETDRNILRYEIYMRYYSLNLWRIDNPYNFTALGSAIAVPVWVYKRVRGITPHKSGEDFYFLLKLRKFGEIINWNPEKVYPAARYSDRVFFGTGPAMIKGRSGDWSSYPIYDYHLFDEVKESFDAFLILFDNDVDYPMKSFLDDHFKDEKWIDKLRKNNPKKERFLKACTDKVDALRILQYLKSTERSKPKSNSQNLKKFMMKFYAEAYEKFNFCTFDFENSSTFELNDLRDFLVQEEENYQKNNIWSE